ncbi:MAG TPA: hypothetical protein PLB49_14055 [Chitinophagaceae bacterium]|jgi:hypothetical protein|nr:hypothetical protein [Chitinophagaceae bacterium]HPH32977.1 hypothetical protein [Chitinophagaceae bacterium]
MLLFSFLSVLTAPVTDSHSLPSWLAVALTALAAGTLTRKQRRKLRWRLAWEMTKAKMGFRKSKKEKMSVGLIILLVILLAVSFGTAIWLGMLKEFLILIGAFLLFFILLAGAFKREHGHLSSGK